MRKSLATTAAALEATTYPRPVPRGRPSRPGAYGDAFVAEEAERIALERADDAAKKCAERLAGRKSGDDLASPECAAVAAARPAADRLLDLGRSELGGAPIGAGPFLTKSAPSYVKPLLALCHHSAATVLADVASGHADAAGLRCAETIEVARDFVYGGSVLATTTAAACVDAMVAPCRGALEALPDDDRARLRGDLRAVAASLPPFADAAAAERVRIELEACGAYLDPSERALLGPRGRALVAESDHDREALPAGERSLHLSLCLETHEAEELAVKAYRAPKGSPERARAFADYQKVVGKMRVPPLPLDKYEERADAMRSAIEGL